MGAVMFETRVCSMRAWNIGRTRKSETWTHRRVSMVQKIYLLCMFVFDSHDGVCRCCTSFDIHA